MTTFDTAPTDPTAGPERRHTAGLPPEGVGQHRALGGQRPRHGRVPAPAFGFQVSAYAGPETGVRRQGLVPARAGRPSASSYRRPHAGLADLEPRPPARRRRPRPRVRRRRRHRHLRGRRRPRRTAGRGALRARPTTTACCGSSSVATYGETKHTFVDRSRLPRLLLPGLRPARAAAGARPARRSGSWPIDHVVGNVEEGRARRVGVVLRGRHGLRPAPPLRRVARSPPSTRALRSTVVWNGVGDRHAAQRAGRGSASKSQIQEYLDTYRGPGRAAPALRTDDIVARHRRPAGPRRALPRGQRRRTTPTCASGSAFLDLPWDELQRLGILVDHEPDGHLLQLFTEPISDRPTLFIEIIQRGGATRLRRGQLQGAVRVDRAGAGPARQPVAMGDPTSPRPRAALDGIGRYRPGDRRPRRRCASTASPTPSSWPPTSCRTDRCRRSPSRAVVEAMRHGRTPITGPSTLREALAERHRPRRGQVAVGLPARSGSCSSCSWRTSTPATRWSYGWRIVRGLPDLRRRSSSADALDRAAARARPLDLQALAAGDERPDAHGADRQPQQPDRHGVRARTTAPGCSTRCRRRHCLVVLDEAYREFVTACRPSRLGRAARRVPEPRRAADVLQGLRPRRPADRLRASAHPDVVDCARQDARAVRRQRARSARRRCASLAATDEMRARLGARARRSAPGRPRACGAPGSGCADPQANFVWLPAGAAAEAARRRAGARGVVTRAFPGVGVRVTIGDARGRTTGSSTPSPRWRPTSTRRVVAAAHGRTRPIGRRRLDELDSALGPARRPRRGSASPGPHRPDPPTGERWDAGQVWAHLGEFGAYWRGELRRHRRRRCRGAGAVRPHEAGPPSHREIEAHRRHADRDRSASDRARDAAAVLRDSRRADRRRLDRVRAATRRSATWTSGGSSTHFAAGHYEQHADQLDELAER